MDTNFWPRPSAFLDLSNIGQAGDRRARCISIAICDADGLPTRVFNQGQPAHFFYEYEILDDIEVPSGGLEFHDVSGQVIHGKSSLQYSTPAPSIAKRGTRLFYHHVINMDVAVGEYWFSIGLASCAESTYIGYQQGSLTYQQVAPLMREHCRLVDAGSFRVRYDPTGRLLHHGIANLPGNCGLMAFDAPPVVLPPAAPAEPAATDDSTPTIFHVTHWKAGSQWIYKILRECTPERIIEPKPREMQFLRSPLQTGKVYPTVYVTKQQFDSIKLPPNSRHFVVIRDLRDTLISAYFSMKYSHAILEPTIAHMRSELEALSIEDGLSQKLDELISDSARIQLSWFESGEPLIHYEDLLHRDLEILERVLLDDCQFPVTRERLEEVVLSSRFEQLTNGRQRGQEQVTEHVRKGIAGDWRNYFTDRVKQAFKLRYGGLLVATGYEQDLNW